MTRKRTVRRCSVPGCDRKHYGRGWCRSHYGRWYKTGDIKPDVPIAVVTYEVVHGTFDGYHNHGCRCRPCKNAFAAHMRNTFARRAAATPCSVDGCEGGSYARGLCHAHYERQRTGRPLVPIALRPGARGEKPGKRKGAV